MKISVISLLSSLSIVFHTRRYIFNLAGKFKFKSADLILCCGHVCVCVLGHWILFALMDDYLYCFKTICKLCCPGNSFFISNSLLFVVLQAKRNRERIAEICRFFDFHKKDLEHVLQDLWAALCVDKKCCVKFIRFFSKRLVLLSCFSNNITLYSYKFETAIIISACFCMFVYRYETSLNKIVQHIEEYLQWNIKRGGGGLGTISTDVKFLVFLHS